MLSGFEVLFFLLCGFFGWILARATIHRLTWGRYEADRAAPSLQDYLISALREACAEIRVVVAYAFGWLPYTMPAFDVRGGPPILLVHGFAMNRSCWMSMTRRLRARGYTNVYAINLKPLFGSISTMSERLTHDIRDFSSHCGGRHVITIGHSMGGLVIAHARRIQQDLPICATITIGSPYNGTLLARLTIVSCGREMIRGSSFLEHAKPHDSTISIYSRMDTVVIPSKSSVIDPSHELTHCNHNTMLFSKPAFRLLLAEIQCVVKAASQPSFNQKTPETIS